MSHVSYSSDVPAKRETRACGADRNLRVPRRLSGARRLLTCDGGMWNVNASRTVPALYWGRVEMDGAHVMIHRSEVDERHATGSCRPELG